MSMDFRATLQPHGALWRRCEAREQEKQSWVLVERPAYHHQQVKRKPLTTLRQHRFIIVTDSGGEREGLRAPSYTFVKALRHWVDVSMMRCLCCSCREFLSRCETWLVGGRVARIIGNPKHRGVGLGVRLTAKYAPFMKRSKGD